MIELHRGAPRTQMALRFKYDTIWRSKDGRTKGQNIFYSRPILSWLGLSWKGRWFIGVIRTGEQAREDVALTAAEARELSGPAS